jgi:hypothetical protein
LNLSFINPLPSRVGICQLVIRSGIVHRAMNNTHGIGPLHCLILIGRPIGILYFSQQHRNSRRDENNSKVGKEKSSVVTNFFNKKVTSEGHECTHWKSYTAQLDHECIKFIHLLGSHFSPLEIGFRSTQRVFIASIGKEPPVPRQGQHHMGQEEKKEVFCSKKDAETHESRNTNTLITVKLHLDLRNFFQRSFGRVIGYFTHLFHPFMLHFTTTPSSQMEIIQSLNKQKPRCVTLLTTRREQYP